MAHAAVDACTGPGQRRYGSTCCDTFHGDREARFPGMIFLRCRGPQVGQPCHKKADCDIACSCDGGGPLRGGNSPEGPADGTTGVVGVCTGQLQIGVWMCRLDEHGVVGHTIID